jgi:[acyl-carrier-protein] S-malonyltransferase
VGVDGRPALSAGARVNIVLLFPGQGSQKPGMGKDLAEKFPAARAVFDAADAALGVPLSKLCFEGPEEELTATQNAQPALFAHGAAAWAVVREWLAPKVRAAAGHSLGEFTAHHAAGTFGLAEGLKLVRKRGELMADCGKRVPGAMAAILGLAEDLVESACDEAAAATKGVVVPANYNTAEQLVISGDVAAVEKAMEFAKAKGAKRALRLNVSGAFHSPLMESAVDGLKAALDAAGAKPAAFPVWTNVWAAPADDAAAATRTLREQLTSPVRWREEVERLAAAVPGALFVELGPGNVLANLVKRIVPGAETAGCGTAAEVDLLRARVAA